MSITTLDRSSPGWATIPRTDDTLEDFIFRTLVGFHRDRPIFRKDLPAKRVGWLDSARMPSRIHATQDGGERTLCGHAPKAAHLSGRWRIVPEVPRKRRGRSRYCEVCFLLVPKTIPWLDPSEVGPAAGPVAGHDPGTGGDAVSNHPTLQEQP